MRAKPENEITSDRAAALLTIAAAAAYSYGMRILLLCAAAAAVSMAAELFCLYLRKIPFRFRHLDAAVTGVVLVMLMPPAVPLSLVIMSCIFAIIIARGLFGGKDNPVIPAAAAGYCFAMLNAPEAMTLFPPEKTHLPLLGIDRSSLTEGLSAVWNARGRFPESPTEWAVGPAGLPIGSASLVLLAVIALVLICRRSASPWVIVPMTAVIIAGEIALNRFRTPELQAAAACLTNQTLFAIIFLFGDPAFSPPHVAGMLWGLLCACVLVLLARLHPVLDAPVLLAVLAAPVSVFLRSLYYGPRNGEHNERKPNPARGRTAAAPQSDPD